MDEIQTAINRFKEIKRVTYDPICTIILPDNLSEAVDSAFQEVYHNLDKAEIYGLSFDDIATCGGSLYLIEKNMSINTSFLPAIIRTFETYQKMEQEGVKIKC